MGNTFSEGRVAVRLAPLTVDAATTLGWATAFGVCAISYYILRGLFSFEQDTLGRVLGWLGGPGKWVQSKIESAEHKLTHWVGQAAAGSEARMGDAYHATANLAQSVGHEIYGMSIAYWHLAQGVGSLAKSVATGEAWQEIFHNRVRAGESSAHAFDRMTRQHQRAITHADQPPIATGINARTKPIKAHAATTDARVHALQGGYALPHALPRPGVDAPARARAGTAEHGIEVAWDKLRDLSWRTAGLGAVALVTVALTKIGAGWFRCSNVGKVGRRLCGMDPRSLDELLLGTLAIVGTLSITEFARELQGEMSLAVSGIHKLVRK